MIAGWVGAGAACWAGRKAERPRWGAGMQCDGRAGRGRREEIRGSRAWQAGGRSVDGAEGSVLVWDGAGGGRWSWEGVGGRAGEARTEKNPVVLRYGVLKVSSLPLDEICGWHTTNISTFSKPRVPRLVGPAQSVPRAAVAICIGPLPLFPLLVAGDAAQDHCP
jgi:hypothetical protein